MHSRKAVEEKGDRTDCSLLVKYHLDLVWQHNSNSITAHRYHKAFRKQFIFITIAKGVILWQFMRLQGNRARLIDSN